MSATGLSVAAAALGMQGQLALARVQAREQLKLELAVLARSYGYTSGRVRSYERHGGGWRASVVGVPGGTGRTKLLAVVEIARGDELAALHALLYALRLGGNTQP